MHSNAATLPCAYAAEPLDYQAHANLQLGVITALIGLLNYLNKVLL